jgi:hypothetical protein
MTPSINLAAGIRRLGTVAMFVKGMTVRLVPTMVPAIAYRGARVNVAMGLAAIQTSARPVTAMAIAWFAAVTLLNVALTLDLSLVLSAV